MMMFCGHEPHCLEFNGERALAAAKANVERHYAVVGVMERMNDTLRVLENELPSVFQVRLDLFFCFEYK